VVILSSAAAAAICIPRAPGAARSPARRDPHGGPGIGANRLTRWLGSGFEQGRRQGSAGEF